MTTDATPTPPGPRLDAIAEGRQFVDDARARMDGALERADSAITRGQDRVFRFLWLFLPEPSVATKRPFQFLLASVFLSDAARDGIRYGALIAVAREGGSTFESALVGAVSLLPPTFLGLYGGAVADALPKRLALTAVYILDAAMCFVIPIFYGTGLGAILMLIFAVNAFGQISGPQEQSITPLVASDEELATATSLMSLASNLGTIFGTALLAPILVKLVGVRAVFYLAGVLLLVASGRMLNVRTEQDAEKFVWKRPDIDVRATVRWLIDRPPVATMIVVAVLAGMANLIVQTLAPQYVEEVLGVDPADAVYVFAPTTIGLALALAAGPYLINKVGERVVALSGFAVVTLCLFLLGFAGRGATDITDPFNPLRTLGVVGLNIGGPLRTAAFLAMPIGLGMSLTTTSVQTYINRRVPLSYQGRAFALQSTLKNGATIIPLLTLGAIASVIGVDTVLVLSPFALLAVAYALVQLSIKLGGSAPTSRLEVLSSFWEEPTRATEPPA
jgi:MFS family permease